MAKKPKLKAGFKLFIAAIFVGLILLGVKIFHTTSTVDSIKSENSSKIILNISGSNTIGDVLAPALIKGFLDNSGYKNISTQDSSKDEKIISCTNSENKEVEVHISAHGTKVGFESLNDKAADICMASTPSSTGTLEEHIIGLDGIAVIINNNSHISNLTAANLHDIFSGTISDWNQIKNSDMTGKINVFRMDDNSGTFKMFKEMIGNIEFDASAQKIASSSEMVSDIGSTKNSIGFVSFAFLNNTVRTVPINNGFVSIEPNSLSIQSEKYPFCRRLYMYKNGSIENKLASELLKYIESEKGQKIVENSGFIDLSVNYDKLVALPEDPKEYVNLINNAKKLTSELRFNTGSKDLDSRAIVDIDRLISFLSQPDNRKKTITLVGFSDNVGDSKSNTVLSKGRAEAVQQILEQKGAVIKDVIGLGPLRPSRSNDTEEGRSNNRRVEIWIL